MLNKQADANMLKDDQTLWNAQHKNQLDAIQGLSKSWSGTLGQMMTGQMTFAKGIQSIWQGLASTIGNVLSNIIDQWLEKQLTALILGKTQQGITGVAQVTSNAAVAASGAYAATAMIPIIGPELAPAAAATAFGGAMAFAPIASAAGGDWDVREGMYHLHEKEMVLPSHLASPLRNMISGGGANDNARGGDSHLHYSPTINGSAPKSLAQMLHEEGDAMHAWFGRAARNGQIKIGR